MEEKAIQSQLEKISAEMAANAASVGKVDQFVDLLDVIQVDQCDALNQDPKTAPKLILKRQDDNLMMFSDEDDPQLIIRITFNQLVKLNAIAIKADYRPPENCSGPKTVKLFINCPHLDFDEAEDAEPVQALELSVDQLNGAKIPLRFVKFQKVSSLQVFLQSNQSDSDRTFVNRISVYGIPIAGMNVNEIKKDDENHD